MNWHRPEEILQHPECHSTAMNIVTILVILRGHKIFEPSIGSYTKLGPGDDDGWWRVMCSNSQFECVAWMPMPQPPEWVGEGKR